MLRSWFWEGFVMIGFRSVLISLAVVATGLASKVEVASAGTFVA
jgi:hypothetical protein